MRITIEIDEARLRSLTATMKQAEKIIAEEVPNALDKAAQDFEKEARVNALKVLPRRGGLAARVASSDFSRKTRRAGISSEVEITASGDYNLQGIDEGTVIHPVYGRGPWVTQGVTPGWFTSPLGGIEEELMEELESLVHRAISIIR